MKARRVEACEGPWPLGGRVFDTRACPDFGLKAYMPCRLATSQISRSDADPWYITEIRENFSEKRLAVRCPRGRAPGKAPEAG
jgi:hypothetical protein